MDLVFDSNALPERDRYEVWREEFMRGGGWTFDVERRGTSPFDVRVYGRTMGNAALMAQQASPCAVSYGSREIARLERPWLFLVLTLAGSFVDRHASGMMRVRAGDLVLHDLTQPFVCESVSSRHYTLGLRLSPDEIQECLSSPLPAILKFDRNNGNVALLANYLRSLARLDAATAAEYGNVYAEHVRDLLRIVLQGNGEAPDGEGRQGHTAALLSALQDHVQRHLTDSSLDPASAATRFGISVRRLHQLFEETGQTFSDFLWERRLDACYKALMDPAQDWRSITEIAIAHGFNSLSHFCRRFKAAYGVSPRQVRAQRG
jgi:AraC-like DNA-binding protein